MSEMHLYFYCLLMALLLWQPNTLSITAQDDPIPNVVAIDGDRLYLSKMEVSNINYHEYLYWLRTRASAQVYQAALPDTTAWLQLSADNTPFVETYFRNPAYSNHPVVNLTYEQAQAYCAWLTDRLNENLARSPSHLSEVVVRLPTESEWEMAAYGSQPYGLRAWYPWGSNHLRYQGKGKRKGYAMANYFLSHDDYIGIAIQATPNKSMLDPQDSGFETGGGFYHLSGNAAEMVQERGFTKGGSFLSTGMEIRISERGQFLGPHPTVGFRYLVEAVSFSDPLQPAELTAKSIEDRMQAIGESGKYADQFEVSNRDFARFLQDFPEYKPEISNWEGTDYATYDQYAQRETYANHPVVNISYEAAQAYCNWLTKTYNQFSKRSFQKVKFHLPSSSIYTLAARGGMEDSPYPWGGPYVRNARGSYLANFSPRDRAFMRSRLAQDESGAMEYYYDYPNNDYSISRGNDGEAFIANVGAYHPNGFGLFNMAGNVAEMLEGKGVSQGGSWLTDSYYMLTEITNTYEGPQIDLGFRVYMTVEEK